MAARGVQVLKHAPYSLDLAPADFFLFTKTREELAGRHLSQEAFKTAMEGVCRSFTAEDFAAAFRRWLDSCNKCVKIGRVYA